MARNGVLEEIIPPRTYAWMLSVGFVLFCRYSRCEVNVTVADTSVTPRLNFEICVLERRWTRYSLLSMVLVASNPKFDPLIISPSSFWDSVPGHSKTPPTEIAN